MLNKLSALFLLLVAPAGVKHDAHNTGTTTLKLVGVYVVEKGKPLTTPAP